MKVGEAVAYWYFVYRGFRHSESTVQVVWSYIRVHVKPSPLGQMRLEDARTADYQNFLNQLLKSGNRNKLRSLDSYGKPLSVFTVVKIRQLLVATCKWAVREGLIPKNYAEETETIKFKKFSKMAAVFTIEQQRAFLEKTKSHRYYFAYILFFYTGCRRGEILGLCWDNVYLDKRYICIRNTLIMIQGVPTFRKDHAKNDSSLRIIPLPSKICDMFKVWRDRQAREKACCETWHNPFDLVFTYKDGSAVNPAYFSRNFKNVCKALGFPPGYHLHSTRHTWATNMLQSGVSISDVQALGGWSSPEVLLNVYSHSFSETRRKAIDTMFSVVSSAM